MLPLPMSLSPRPYLPVRLIARLEAAPMAEDVSVATVATAGVVFFVDISGFTQLTDLLGETKGGAGIDQLARVLGEKFARIVERIEAAGGEVVAFAGDAVLAWWEASDPAGQGAAILKATACSRAIEGELATPIEGLTVQVRQAIAVGALRALRVGDAPCVALLDGEAVTQLAEVAGAPPGGPVALTASARRLASQAKGALPVTEPSGVAEMAPLPVAALDRYIDALLWANGTGEVRPPELRVVTAMFVRLAETVLDPDRVHLAVVACQREITRHRGSILSVGRDDKGIVIAAAFGLPAREVFHPSDPPRAAVAVGAALSDLGVGAGIGLATGRTYFGAALFGDRHRFDVIGSPMNLASRLMMLGLGAWCDPATARGARGAVRLADGRPLRFKGFAQPIMAWRLVDLAVDPGEGTFVGRNAAMATIGAALDRARGGQGGRVFVTGEPGIGKSAVLREARARAGIAGFEVIDLGGGATDTPFGAWAPALRRVLGRSTGDRSTLAAALGEHAGLAPLLSPILGFGGDETEATAELKGFLRAARTVELIAALLSRSPGGPARVVMVDDLLALDERSSQVLERVVEDGGLALMTLRALDSLPVARGGPLVTLHLGPLDREEVMELVRVGLGGRLRELPPGLLDWLMVRAQGHPHFTLELLAVAQERGFLELDAAGRVLYFDRASMEATSPPDSVQAALATRLDQLPAAAGDALKAASAVGIDVPSAVLRPLVLGDFEGDTQVLVDSGWLIPTDAGFRWARPTARDAVHALLVRSQRRRFHGALAEALGSSDVEPAILANHLAHAGAIPPAIAQLDRAWHRAMDGCLPRAAVDLALRAVSLDDEAAELGQPTLTALERATWHYRVAVACRGFGDTTRAITHLDAAAAELGLEFPSSVGAWRLHLLSELVRHAFERVTPARLGPGDALRASVLNLLSLSAYLRSKPAEQLLAIAVRAVRLGWRTSRTAIEAAPATALATSMLTIATSGILPLADAYGREGERRARLSGDRREVLDAALGRLMLDIAHTRWEGVEELVGSLLPELRASQSDTLHAAYLGLFAVADLLTGQVERCASRCREMIAVAERESYLQARGWARNVEATLALLAGDLEGARRCADEAETILERRREPEHLTPRAIRAAIALRANAMDTATREIAALEPLLAEELVSMTGLETYATPVEVHLIAALGGEAGALARADKSFRALRAYVRQFPLGTPRLLTLEAFRARVVGRPSAPAFSRAAEEALRRRMPLETLRILELTGGDPTALRERLAAGWTPRSPGNGG